MGTSVLFSALTESGEATGVGLSQVRELFEGFGIHVGDLGNGSHAITLVSPPGNSVVLHDELLIDVEHGDVTSIWIDRPCSPGGNQLWFALLNKGFIMVTAHDGQVFATPNVAKTVARSFPGGPKVVESPEDLPL